MEVDKLREYLNNCCRVCLEVENGMMESSSTVEYFSKTLEQLLSECANLKILSDENYPKKICEDCVAELVMVAKFNKKCGQSTIALERLIYKIKEAEQTEPLPKEIKAEIAEEPQQNDSEPLLETIEYSDENVEYVIYDTDFIEEAVDTQDKPIETHRTERLSERIKSSANEATPTKSKATSSKPTKTEHKSPVKYHCRTCGAVFAQMNNYTRHKQTHHREMNIEPTAKRGRPTVEAKRSVEVKSEDVTKPENNNEAIPNAANQNGKNRRILLKNHFCEYCNRAFPSSSFLATHIRIHTGERPFQCSKCTKTFKTQGALDLHTRRHSGVKPYNCTECNRGFVESNNLKVHMRTHTGEKPHRCTICGRDFSRVFLLQIHQRTHTGEKPYQCDFETCHKSFAQQGDLAAHKRIHTGERPHECKICGKGFIKSSGLTQHMRKHTRPKPLVNTKPASIVESDRAEQPN